MWLPSLIFGCEYVDYAMTDPENVTLALFGKNMTSFMIIFCILFHFNIQVPDKNSVYKSPELDSMTPVFRFLHVTNWHKSY